jgi:hypothetical protein
VIPKYAKIKFGNSSPAAIVTTKKAQITRIKDEIKFLFKKKGKLNELYKAHLMAAQEWGSVWDSILMSIHESLNREMERKYKALDTKIGKLTQTQVNNISLGMVSLLLHFLNTDILSHKTKCKRMGSQSA